jgi:hypothetical protein
MTLDSASEERVYVETGAAGARTTSSSAVPLVTVFMVVGGAFHVLEGLAAMINGDFFASIDDYAYGIDITTWAWIHLVVGCGIALIGLAVLGGSLWARVFALFAMVLSAIINFTYIPYQPTWSIVLLVIDGVVIWTLISHLDMDETPR